MKSTIIFSILNIILQLILIKYFLGFALIISNSIIFLLTIVYNIYLAILSNFYKFNFKYFINILYKFIPNTSIIKYIVIFWIINIVIKIVLSEISIVA